jgi:hypothetical protein
MTLYFRDIWGRRVEPQIFWKNEKSKILLFHFHNSVRALLSICDSDIFDSDTIIVQSSAWFLDELRVFFLKQILDELQAKAPKNFKLERNLILLANSNQEKRIVEKFIPNLRTIHVNNTCFLDENLFFVSEEAPEYDAVLNSKPAPFKRHYLSRLVENKIFISYGANQIQAQEGVPPVNLESFMPRKIFWNLPSSEIPAILSRSAVGLILSEKEGACYASTEYLLCGLPVVSTLSRGGRDDYYDPENSIIADSNEVAVANAVKLALWLRRKGIFVPQLIRKNTIKRMIVFRKRLCEALSERLKNNTGAEIDFTEHLEKCIRKSSKLLVGRNFWIKEAEQG